MIEFKLPSLGADMDEGTLLTWHVKPGDDVKRGQVVAVVDTSKAAVDVEIWHEGQIRELRVQVGEKIPVGTVLAVLQETSQHSEAPPEPGISPKPSEAVQRRAVTPSARRRAKEKGLDPNTLSGTGAQGAVTLGDVEAAAARSTPIDRQQEMRRAIAAAMSRSKREIPHYYLSETIDMSKALHWLQQYNQSRPITERILSAVLLLKAVALADLVKRARAGSLRSSEMSDPTITVTNLGEQSVGSVFGVIYPPQVALVGFGNIRVQPWVVDGEVRPAPLLCATLAADHRASDGHLGALFLAALRELLQHPQAVDDPGVTDTKLAKDSP